MLNAATAMESFLLPIPCISFVHYVFISLSLLLVFGHALTAHIHSEVSGLEWHRSRETEGFFCFVRAVFTQNVGVNHLEEYKSEKVHIGLDFTQLSAEVYLIPEPTSQQFYNTTPAPFSGDKYYTLQYRGPPAFQS